MGLGLIGAILGLPRRYEVAGISMAPGLLSGDVVTTGWLPWRDRWRAAARQERWIATLPDGSTAIKRVVGLPGERLAIAAGDLVIDGETVLKQPCQLAEIGSLVAAPAAPSADTTTIWSLPPQRVLDEAPFATDEPSRRLLPVRDVGFAAVVRVTGSGGARGRSRCGPLGVTWRLGPPGRYAVVTGRLDGRAVAAAWRLPVTDASPWLARSCLPVNPPRQWPVSEAWPKGADLGSAGSPELALTLASADAESAAVIETIAIWRDTHYLPPATGTTTWQVEPDTVFLLGDFPAASRDSRHVGCLPTAALRHRIVRVP